MSNHVSNSSTGNIRPRVSDSYKTKMMALERARDETEMKLSEMMQTALVAEVEARGLTNLGDLAEHMAEKLSISFGLEPVLYSVPSHSGDVEGRIQRTEKQIYNLMISVALLADMYRGVENRLETFEDLINQTLQGYTSGVRNKDDFKTYEEHISCVNEGEDSVESGLPVDHKVEVKTSNEVARISPHGNPTGIGGQMTHMR